MEARLTPKTVALDGLLLFVLEAGENRLPLLILHGFASSALAWTEVIRALAPQRRVLAYDRPGFGLTAVTSDRWHGLDPYAPAAQVPIARALVQHLGVGRFAVLGHSMGGRLAYELARALPDQVVAAILVTPAWERPSTPRLARFARQPLVGALVRSVLRTSSPLALHVAQRRVWASPPPKGREELASVAVSLAGWDERLWRVTLATLADSSARRPEQAPTVPTLVVLGEHDRIVSNERTLQVVADWQAAGAIVRVERCARSGHLPHVEEFAQFVQLVEEFLEEVEHAETPAR
jgi:pimeloyl-ACP methyl ester carboxylesterase